MRIFTLTPLGWDMAKTVTRVMTPGWQVVYFLKRHGGRGTDEQIQDFAGIETGQFNILMRNLEQQKVVAVTR